MLYDRARYEYRGKFAETRFKRDCLAEYAEVFKTVCVDAAYYSFPSQQYLESMVNQTPDDFMFGLKVTDTITIRKFPKLGRFGQQAGKANENFLNADLFAKAFLKPCESVRHAIGLLMFEFSRFWPTDYEHGRDFIADLDKFLGQLPKGWPYGVEMRNRNWLKPEYFECLARHQVAHVFNSWDAMPAVGEQMALPGSRTNPNLVAARFLLKPGRKYEQAVKAFEPYDSIKEENPEARYADGFRPVHQRGNEPVGGDEAVGPAPGSGGTVAGDREPVRRCRPELCRCHPLWQRDEPGRIPHHSSRGDRVRRDW